MCNVHSVVQYKMCDAHYKLREFYTYNIYNALHMALDVKRNGEISLVEFSSVQFSLV